MAQRNWLMRDKDDYFSRDEFIQDLEALGREIEDGTGAATADEIFDAAEVIEELLTETRQQQEEIDRLKAKLRKKCPPLKSIKGGKS